MSDISNTRNHPTDLIGRCIANTGIWISAAALMLLGISSLFVSYKSGIAWHLTERLTRVTALNEPIGFLSLVSILMMLCLAFLVLMRASKSWNPFFVLAAVTVLTVVFQVWWINSQQANGTYYSDARQMLQYAREIATGSMQSFDASIDAKDISELSPATRYLLNYPYQSGILIYFTLAFTLFGNNAPFAIQCVNIAANTVTIISLSLIGFLLTRDTRVRCLVVVMLGLFIPHLLYASFMYGNQVGFGCACMTVTMNASAMTSKNQMHIAALIAGSVVPLVIMMWLKSTFVIIAICVAVVWLIRLFLERSPAAVTGVVLFMIVFAISAASSSAPQHYLEGKLGYSFGKGMPKTAWIAIGLQDESVLGDKMPGWWNYGALERQVVTENNYEEQSRLALEDIKSSIDEMLSNPLYGIKFFARKLGTEWLNPDFQARYFAGINYEIESGELYDSDANVRQFNVYPRDITAADSKAERIENTWEQIEGLVPFMEAYQSFIYTFAFLGVLAIKRRAKNDGYHAVELILPCIFITGAFVYLLWEAKSQYIMPFFMMLIPLASIGFSVASKGIKKSN